MRLTIAVTAALIAVNFQNLSAQAAWRADAAPILDVSSTTSAGKVVFARVSGATRLSNGTIVIADADDHAVHYFDATGKMMRDAGRMGSGPGEFQHVSWMGRCGGDSVHVWDFIQRRMSVFKPDGSFARQYIVPSDAATIADTTRPHTPFLTLACSSRGVLAYQSQPFMSKAVRQSVPTDRPNPVIPSIANITMSNTTGALTRNLGDSPAGSMYMVGHGGFPLPLGPATYIAVVGDRVAVGTADSTSSLLLYSAGDGHVAMIVKLGIAPRRTTPVQRAKAVTAMASMAPPAMRQMAEDSLSRAPIPTVLPPYSRLLGDSDGILWVQLSMLGDAATKLRAVNSSGKTVSDITLPPDLVVHEIGRDYVLASYDDKDDLPHVVMYRLHRGN